MNVTHVVSLGISMAFAVVLAGPPMLAQTPVSKSLVVEQPAWITHASASDLFGQSESVVRVRVVRAEPVLIHGPAPLPHVFTRYDVQLLQAYSGAPESRLTVYQKAGTAEDESHIYRVADAEPLSVNREYILFLNRNDFVGGWVVAGLEGAYEVAHHGALRPLGRGAAAREISRANADSFRDGVRRQR